MLTARAIMTEDIVTITPEASIKEAIELMLLQRISGLPVCDNEGHMVGVITEYALLAIAYDQKIQCETVAQHMTTDVLSIDIDDPISKAADLCIVHRVRRVPVLQNGHLAGLISRRDVLKALYESEAPVCTA
ncbi:MAG: CBS domain-containing protein [Planctomycetes bacterium]|nr:CBS domain-containing protein [Planctomycetota bacterium]